MKRHTSNEIRNALRVLYDATQEHQQDDPPVRIDKETLRAWTAEMEEEKCAGNSVRVFCPCCGEAFTLAVHVTPVTPDGKHMEDQIWSPMQLEGRSDEQQS